MRTAPGLAASFASAMAFLVLVAPAPSPAGDDHRDHAARAAPGAVASPAQARLEQLKALAGTWTGTARHGEGRGPLRDATVVWRVTAGGTAVTETLFPGTPHEMMTVYTVDGDDLVLTHFCASGNQPAMKARPSGDPRVIPFEFTHGGNMQLTDSHMHSAVLTLASEDQLEADWTTWEGGKAGGVAHFVLTRQK